jgi:DNA polymerase III epsilon subunit-like protein
MYFRINKSYNTARILQIAWLILDDKFQTLEERNYIVKRDRFVIPKSSYHNITNKVSDRKGIIFDIIVQDLALALQKCSMIVSHNILFDINVLANHLHRYAYYDILESLLIKNKFCTSLEATQITKIPIVHKPHIFKYPSLNELYIHYFKKSMDNHHDALADTIACADCFIMIIRDFNENNSLIQEMSNFKKNI